MLGAAGVLACALSAELPASVGGADLLGSRVAAGQERPALVPTPMPEAYGLVDTWLPETPTGMKLFHPMGIAVDGHGNVVVAEAGNGRLTRATGRGTDPDSLDPNARPRRIGRAGSGPGEFLEPEDVAVSADGQRIYVADTGNRRVQALSPDGTVVGIWSDVGLPRGIALGPGGGSGQGATEVRVYVSDAEGARVRVFRDDGTWLADWPLENEHALPLGLCACPTGDLIVADHANQRLLWLDADGSDGTPGAIVGRLDLDNVLGPGGAPTDAAMDAMGEVYVAVARGVLRFRPAGGAAAGNDGPGTGVASGLAYAETWPMLRGELPATCAERGCAGPGCRPEFVVERDSHEGVQRLDLQPSHGLYVTVAPALRWPDRVVVLPARRSGGISPPQADLGWVWPLECRDYIEAEFRHETDLERVDDGPGPLYSVGLDSAPYLRIRQADGSWYGGMRAMQAVDGTDLAVNAASRSVAILDENLVHVVDPLCLLSGFAPETCRLPPERVLVGSQTIRRERTGECRRAEPVPWRSTEPGPCIPDDRWWNTAVASEGPVWAALDAGLRRLVIRTTGGDLAALESLGAPREAFRSFVDLDYDARGQLWVLSQDGTVQVYDEHGRDLGRVTLTGPAEGRSASLSVAPDGTLFVLTGDGRVVKYALATAPPITAEPTTSPTPGPSPRPTRVPPRPTATARPTLASMALPLAAWSPADHAGPGRYRDLAVGDDGRVIVPDADHDRRLVFAPLEATPTPMAAPSPGPGPCRVEPDKRADPTRLLLGETTEVTLRLAGDCGSRHTAVDVAVVVDISCQMAGERFARARDALTALVDAMTLPGDRVALLTFLEDQGSARVVVPSTSDRQRLHDAVADLATDCHLVEECFDLDFKGLGYIKSYLYPYGCRTEGRISDGLRAGREALFGPMSRPEAGKVLLLLSPSLFDSRHVLATMSRDPRSFEPPFSPTEQARWDRDLPADAQAEVTDREHARWEAWKLREAGVRVYATGVGVDSYGAGHPPDEGLLAFLAWPADGYRPAGSPGDLVDVLGATGREISARTLLAGAVITDRIPANMRLVAGSVRPAAEVLQDGGRADALLRWTLPSLALGQSASFAYRLEPLADGTWPTNVEAFTDYVDGLGHRGRVDFPVPVVEVVGPSPSPPPSATPTTAATSTAGPSPTAPQPTATPTTPMSSTPTPSAEPARLYLPFALAHRCKPGPRPVDVVLVIDTSSSMAGAKLTAAVAAADVFATLLDLRPGQDRGAVVGFDGAARLVQPLTHDELELRAALGALAPSPGTRIDLGLRQALDELLGARARPDVDRAVVLLTDGLPASGTRELAIAQGDRARAGGVPTWSIGLGVDVDPDLLTALSGSPDHVLLAPTADQLERVYRRVASGIVCR